MNSQDISPRASQEANLEKHININETKDAEIRESESSSEDEQGSAKEQWKEMREERINDNIDPSLQSPQDANTQKHIDFVETEEAGTTVSQHFSEDEQNSTKQQLKEMREERMNDNTDPSLQSPQDANTQKHINFLETEESGTTDDE